MYFNFLLIIAFLGEAQASSQLDEGESVSRAQSSGALSTSVEKSQEDLYRVLTVPPSTPVIQGAPSSTSSEAIHEFKLGEGILDLTNLSVKKSGNFQDGNSDKKSDKRVSH